MKMLDQKVSSFRTVAVGDLKDFFEVAAERLNVQKFQKKACGKARCAAITKESCVTAQIKAFQGTFIQVIFMVYIFSSKQENGDLF